MSRELEDKLSQWRREQAKNDPGTAVVLRRETTRETVQQKHVGAGRGQASLVHIPEIAPDEATVDLPRICAVTDQLWMVRYIRHNGVFRLGRPIIPEQLQQGQYAAENTRRLPDSFSMQREFCPCCGTWTPSDSRGSIWCEVCKTFICFGRTIEPCPPAETRRYCYCRKSCGGHGWMNTTQAQHMGVIPAFRRL